MAVHETLRARQAALLVHGLPLSAQRRVVAQLGQADSARLKPLLDELNALGVSRSLGHALRYATLPGTEGSAAHAQAASLNAEDVARALEDCAPPTVACILRAADWPWKSAVLDLFSDASRARVLECLRRDFAPLAPAAMRTLCEQLCLHAAQVRRARSNSGTSPGGVGIRLRRWLGWTP